MAFRDLFSCNFHIAFRYVTYDNQLMIVIEFDQPVSNIVLTTSGIQVPSLAGGFIQSNSYRFVKTVSVDDAEGRMTMVVGFSNESGENSYEATVEATQGYNVIIGELMSWQCHSNLWKMQNKTTKYINFLFRSQFSC
jgi:hypothetical protein